MKQPEAARDAAKAAGVRSKAVTHEAGCDNPGVGAFRHLGALSNRHT